MRVTVIMMVMAIIMIVAVVMVVCSMGAQFLRSWGRADAGFGCMGSTGTA